MASPTLDALVRALSRVEEILSARNNVDEGILFCLSSAFSQIVNREATPSEIIAFDALIEQLEASSPSIAEDADISGDATPNKAPSVAEPPLPPVEEAPVTGGDDAAEALMADTPAKPSKDSNG